VTAEPKLVLCMAARAPKLQCCGPLSNISGGASATPAPLSTPLLLPFVDTVVAVGEVVIGVLLSQIYLYMTPPLLLLFFVGYNKRIADYQCLNANNQTDRPTILNYIISYCHIFV